MNAYHRPNASTPHSLFDPILALLLVGGLFGGAMVAGANKLDRYNVVWNSPSRNAHGSMPLGNGDIGINAWVEPSGDLVFYISKTDAWDENGRLCKVGRVRVKFDPALKVSESFRQELKLRDGVIAIGTDKTRVELWVDANQPVVQLQARSETPVSCRAEVELWRLRERPFVKDEESWSGPGLENPELGTVVLPDVVVKSSAPSVVWYHRNTRSIFPLTLQTQHLEALQGQFTDPLLALTFGAKLAGKDFVRDGEQAIQSSRPANQHELAITVLTSKGTWPEEIERLKTAPNRPAHEKWWHDFWDRSWVFVEGNLPPPASVGQAPVQNGGKSGGVAIGEPLTRGYVLQRFMNACAGRGGSPIKFNGSIFTVEEKPGESPETPGGNPDWRRWGGCYWFQNTRHSYWAMLKSGDLDLMEPWFRMYRDALPLSRARIETYYQFKNAALFPEIMHRWGLPNNFAYGWNNKAPEPDSPFIRRHWSGNLELIAVMLDRYDFTRDDKFAGEVLLPMADPLISFFDQYWKKRDANGKIVFDPAQSLEQWGVAVNPMPEIAGLRFVLPRLLALRENLTTEEQRARWRRMLKEIPPLPVKDGLLQPAETFSQKKNVENPELYAVFPFRLYGVGQPDLEMARASYYARENKANRCWRQDSIQAACLGLGEEAGRLVAARAKEINGRQRFPAMWAANNDWVPDQDHGSIILTTLHAMLLQSVGDKIHLLPAWPKAWNVCFKLHAPRQTTVEGIYRNGKLEQLKVTPPEREKDLVMPNEGEGVK